MRRIVTIATFLLCIATAAYGQGKIGLSAMGGMTLPVGDFGDVYDSGIGGKGMLFFQLSPGIEVTGTVGYLKWDADFEIFGVSVENTLTSIPLLAGLRYYFGGGAYAPYATVEGGFHFLKSEGIENGQVIYESDREDLFGYGAGAGLLFRAGDNLFIDLGVMFNSITDSEIDDYTSDFLSFMLGVRFGF